jgi:hypothetical protein
MIKASPTIRLKSASTKAYAWAAFCLCVTGSLLDALAGALWIHLGIHGRLLESAGGGLFWLGYLLLWTLLPLSLFRPNSRFYLGGSYCSRAKIFVFTAILLLAAHALIFLSAYMAFGR